MQILGIETSCDDCSLSIVESGRIIHEMVMYSQLEEHRQYNGIVPELASRVHVKYISVLYQQLLKRLNTSDVEVSKIIDGIAVTVCPGLSGSLMVGLHFAKGLAMSLGKPLLGIDHIQAHFYSGQLVESIEYPYIGVVVSGGHTLIGIVHSYDNIEIKGASLDDACGEVFEKISRELGLGYPGGPKLDERAQLGDINAANFPKYRFKKYGYNYSYSGLKTAVLNHKDKYWNKDYPQTIENIAASFQAAAIEMIIERVQALIIETGINRVSLGGGVACNSYLKKRLLALFQDEVSNGQLVIPPPELCADNAAMIAGLGHEYLSRGIISTLELGVNAREYRYRAY